MDAIHRAQITRVTPNGIYVIVPKLGFGVEYGPCPRLADTPATTVAGGSGYAHEHASVSQYTPGANVLVCTINGIPDNLAVLGLLV